MQGYTKDPAFVDDWIVLMSASGLRCLRPSIMSFISLSRNMKMDVRLRLLKPSEENYQDANMYFPNLDGSYGQLKRFLELFGLRTINEADFSETLLEVKLDDSNYIQFDGNMTTFPTLKAIFIMTLINVSSF